MAGRLFIMPKMKIGKILAKAIQSSLSNAIDIENKREAKSIDNVYIVEHVDIPLAIVECGFLSNKEEAARLIQDEYQDRLAYGIFTGINSYFNK